MFKEIKNKIKKIIEDNTGQADAASTLYMFIVVAVVAVILIAVVKPMFSRSMKTQVNLSKLPGQNVESGAS